MNGVSTPLGKGSGYSFDVSFEFRFKRDIAGHDLELAKRTELTQKFAEEQDGKFPNQIKNIHLYPVARAGNSGSEVFYLDVFVKTISYPQRFIAKFQSIKKTNLELNSAQKAQFARICGPVSAVYNEDDDLGMLVYDLAKIHDHMEFRGYFLDTQYTDENCSLALASIYKTIGKHPNDNGEERKPFLEDYDWYLKRSSQPIFRIDSFVATCPDYTGVSTLAEAVKSHYSNIVALLEKDEILVFPYLVHGDLHARNLMLSAGNPSDTELIDFGWTHFGHPAKDFSLMEATLKYMLLHELLRTIGKSDGSNPHLPLIAFVEFEKYLCMYVFDLPEVTEFETHISKVSGILDHHITGMRRVYISLKELRGAAKITLNEYCDAYDKGSKLTPEQHFLISNFFITLGLNGFQEVEPIWTLVGLDIVGKTICQP